MEPHKNMDEKMPQIAVSLEEQKSKLIKLSEALLNEKGQEDVQEYLDDDDFDGVRTYLLGVLDAMVAGKKISDEDAKLKYKILNFDPEEASRIRQRSKHAKDFK